MYISQAMVRNTVESDIEGIKGVIEATGLFPTEMFEPIINPFFSEGSDGSIWLTLCDPGPIGAVYCVPEMMAEGTWNMLMIAVHPDYQNSGRGAQLVSELEAQLRLREARLILVETSSLEQYEQARTFYRKLGYVQEARLKDFYAPGEDKLIFTKPL